MCFIKLNNAIGMFCLAPIGLEVAKFYEVSVTVVNLLPAMGCLVIALASLPTSYLIERYGSSRVILVASVLNSIGCATKLLVNQSFWFCILGGISTNLTWIVGLSSSTKLAATWFGENERVIAISIMIVAQSIGFALGFAMPAIFFDEDMDQDQFRHVMFQMMCLQVTLAAI